MCYICRSAPHESWCPFYCDASFDKCSVCGNGIYRGQRFFDLKSERIHQDCIGNLSVFDILDALQVKSIKKQ